jgi:hypothetical protein
MDQIIFGSASNLLRFKLVDKTTGQGKTGLSSSTVGLVIGTIADNEATSTAYTQAGNTIETITTLGTYQTPTATKCRFKEVDATNHKGLYEFQFADARFMVANSKRLVISVNDAENTLLDADYIVKLVKGDATNQVPDIRVADAVAHGGTPGSSSATWAMQQENIHNPNGTAVSHTSTGGNGHGLAITSSGTGNDIALLGTGAIFDGVNNRSVSVFNAQGRVLGGGNGAFVGQGAITDALVTPCTDLNDYTVGGLIDFDFNTAATLSGAPSVQVFKDGSAVAITVGITLTVNFAAETGLNHVTIDTSASASYSANSNYDVVIAAGTVSGTSVVGKSVGHFTLQKATVAKVTGNGGAGSQIVQADIRQVIGTAITESGAGRDAAALTHFLDVAAPALTAASVNQTTDLGAAVPELIQGVPPATPTIGQAVMLLYMALRNGGISDATHVTVQNDAGVVITKFTQTDDGSAYTHAKMITGP